MKRGRMVSGLIAGVLAFVMTACAAPQTGANPQSATAVPTARATATPRPTITLQTPQEPVAVPVAITGAGEVKVSRDADLIFQVPGVVGEVYVTEGDAVKKGDLLAVLDTRTFDQQLQQAEAALASARAQEQALTEEPREADLQAARAQVAQALANLELAQQGAKEQDIANAQTGVELARINVQATRDRLSFAKTQAELQVEQSALQLTQAQARYSQAKYNWEYARDTGNDPIVPRVTTGTGQQVPNKISDGQRENYYAQFVQAEAALKQAEKAVELAVKVAENARQSEVTGVQAAEQQLRQAELSLERVQLPPDAARIKAARAALDAARAQEARLRPDPRDSQKAQVAAAIAQAEAALTLARVNRERAELRAPFDAVVAIVNVDPGDAGTPQGQPAIRIVDVNGLRVDVQISDSDVAKLRVGQPAEVRVDAIPGRVFPGIVSYIAPTATSNGAVRTYLVRVALEEQDGLRAGMNARVDIQQ